MNPTTTVATNPIAVSHDTMSHAAGIRRRNATSAATMPIAASTDAALMSQLVAPSISIWPQIWLTISVSLNPQSQYARSIVTCAAPITMNCPTAPRTPATPRLVRMTIRCESPLPSLAASARPSPASATKPRAKAKLLSAKIGQIAMR